jgi:hypothetical protein
MRRVLLAVVMFATLAMFIDQSATALASSPANGDGLDSSATFTRGSNSGAAIGDPILATFFVATGDGTYVCILHPEWGTRTAPAPPN